MDKRPFVSVVLLNHNGLEHLKTALPSILRTNYSNYETVLVDNGSSDGSTEFVRRNFPSVKIVRSKRNIGAAGGYNLGISNAKGKYVAVLNNDIEVDSEWLQPLVKILEESPDVAGVDAKYLNYYDRKRFDSSAAAGRLLDFLGNCFARGVNEEDRGQYDEITRIFTCCTLFRREVLEEVGLFDQDFFYGYEDADLSWRVILRGYQILYVPSSRIYHKSGGTSRTSTRDKRHRPNFYFFWKRNKTLTLLKNYSGKTLLGLLPLVLFEHSGFIIYWSIKRDKQYSLESLKALLWLLKNFKTVWTKHRVVQSTRVISDREIMKTMTPYFGGPISFFRTLLNEGGDKK